jgi:hypothetical protein
MSNGSGISNMNLNEEEDIINTFIDDLSLELCFEMHYAVSI